MDIHDKLGRAQDELWCMEDAISALQDVQGMEHVRQIIKDAMVVKGFGVEQLPYVRARIAFCESII